MKNNFLYPIIFIGVLFILLFYLLYSIYTSGVGFPLDDAWIHQTYARNLATTGVWEYIPGIPSAGSTSPLWTITLSIGYILKISPIFWSYILGALGISGIAWIGFKYIRFVYPSRYFYQWMIVALLILEYHLNWAALSGMETIFFTFIVTLLLLGQLLWRFPSFFVGVIIGVSVWLRPDGLTLLFPIVLLEYLQYHFTTSFFKRSVKILFGFTSIFLAYLAFNYVIAGTIWPSTYYAKQAEYASLLTTPLLNRAINLYSQPLIGVGILLLPSFIFHAVKTIKAFNWTELVAYLWWVGFIGIYIIRLPVTYQHGRYLIPIIPIYLIFGTLGIPELLDVVKNLKIKFIVRWVWRISILLLLVSFWYIGARSFATDVAIIESEMVDVSKWISKNTEPDSLIAAHDIGALGYYSNRNILDLAGLISPEVIPIITNESALVKLINSSDAKYLMTFPDWYKYLSECGETVYSSGGNYVQKFDWDNMVLYKWNKDCTIKN